MVRPSADGVMASLLTSKKSLIYGRIIMRAITSSPKSLAQREWLSPHMKNTIRSIISIDWITSIPEYRNGMRIWEEWLPSISTDMLHSIISAGFVGGWMIQSLWWRRRRGSSLLEVPYLSTGTIWAPQSSLEGVPMRAKQLKSTKRELSLDLKKPQYCSILYKRLHIVKSLLSITECA